ncbi:hypothetical protein C499_10339 [Halogeometricum borinquense DSM 11551]|uniref:Uncharacterized protein n=1 Tax=Halogeometricum borinquense (strain ATCC 700274 / DSM 11551 / JCM 10706 / KCTC 4070 / PR3) TaxID=469382 RepID=E4NLF2_HALBP|nr:hypothetical protein [Halogeometricum borinquense]ADQ66048.1 hypothetical protein Hbor_04440 [Halogeometricum borinquense DSM 11551]ELY27455.1 hypothetical protein C499_10339 [Halogeometricum borinquense DSM 11551]
MNSGDYDSEQETDTEEDTADVSENDTTDDDYEHLKSLDDGVGCTEIWEHLSESRDG